MATVVYLYGPSAAGKLTIAQRLAEQAGLRLLHNHLTVNAIVPVFEFDSPPFVEVLHRLRLDVFATSRNGVDMIFTNSSAWSGENARARFAAFAEEVASTVAANEGTTLFVQVVAPGAALESRVGNESRRAHHKLVDANRLRERLATYDATPLHPDD